MQVLEFSLPGAPDDRTFREAWERLAMREPVLRVRLGTAADGMPTLETSERSAMPVEWGAASPAIAAAGPTTPEESRPLWRVIGTPNPRRERVDVRLELHPALLDERSRLQLLEDLLSEYQSAREGRRAERVPTMVHSVGADWTDPAAAAAFWTQELANTPPTILSMSRPADLSPGALETSRVTMSSGELDALDTLAASLSVRPESLVEAALAIALGRATGADRVRFGVRSAEPAFGTRAAGSLGLFDQARVAVAELDPDMTVARFAELVESRRRRAEAHAWIPLSRVRSFDPLSQTPFDVLLVVDLDREVGLRRDAIAAQLGPVTRSDEGDGTPLTFVLRRSADTELVCQFDPTVITGPRALALSLGVAAVLRQLVQSPAAPMSSLRLDESTEQETPSSQPWDGGVARRISQHAVSAPHETAILCGTETVTFGELDTHAALIGGMLRQVGVGRGDVVGLFLERGAPVAAAVLGILRVGAAWLPLDPAYPRARTAELLRRSGAAVLLTQRTLVGALDASTTKTVVLEEAQSGQPVEPLSMAPDDAAYVIYTSGSTGTPKGVVISHGNVAHYVAAMISTIGVGAADRYMHTASVAFSSSVRQLLVPLAAGATVVIARRDEIAEPRELLRVARTARATVFDLVPSYWARVVEALETDAAAVPSLRLALSASEPLPSSVVKRWFAIAPGGSRFVNMFGQTETTGIVATLEVNPDHLQSAIVPLGRPLPGSRLQILDQYRQPLPAGLDGEIHVVGRGVGRGYLGQPELTAERFLGLEGPADGRTYATGDVGVMSDDGVLTFVGRRDNQVKVRGHRIEVEEVEAVLRSHPAVAEAAVQARLDAAGDARLVAFVAARAAAPTPRELREHLARALPDYMIPAVFQSVEAVPRTPNGKLDRGALHALPVAAGDSAAEHVAPRSTAERRVAEIWEEVLGIPRVGATDHFFESGGHSLTAIRVLARIRTQFGVDVPLRQFFERPTVSALAEILDRSTDVPAHRAALVPLATGTDAPLSFAQERLWVMHQIEPESAAYNLIAAFRIRGRLDRTALTEALTEIETRHAALRTVFPSVDGVARADIRSPRKFPLSIEKVVSGDDREAALLARAASLAAVPFDLAEGPLFTGTLLVADERDHLLVLVMHHVISDGWSRGVLYRELGALYDSFARQEPSALPALTIQYGDYAAWQREWLQDDVMARQAAYWSQQLAGPLPTLDLPTDRPRPPVQTSRGATLSFVLPSSLGNALRDVAASEDATAFMVLLSAYQALLARYSGQEDIIVGSPTAGRTHVETEPLIGFFVNTLPLRADLSGNPSFRELLRRIKRMSLEAFEHQDLPFDRLVEALHLPRDLSRSPVFQTLFILQNTPVHPLTLPGLTLEQVDVDAGAAKFDMTLSLIAVDGGYTGHLEYNTDLFDAATMERFTSHYVRLLESATVAPDRPIGHLEYLPPAERQQLLTGWNATDTPVSHTDTIVSQFEAQVRKTPDANAATFEAETLTYAELNRRANRLAHHLRTLGVGPDVAVGVYMERSLEMLIGMLAVMKAGGAYLPLDPAYPADRVEFMLRDSAAPVLLAHGRLVSRLPNINAKVVRVDVDQAQFATQREDDAAPVAQPTHLAYQIYTSGSTGVPKGVMIEHRNAVNFFTGMDERIGADTPGTWLAVTSISFDISVLELLWTLTRGYHVIVQADPERVREQQAVQRSDRHVGFSLFYFASDAQANPTEKYRILLEGAKFADAHGFEAVWTPERHFHAFGGLYPSPAVVSAALAALTKNVKLRTGSVVLPLHSPVRVAEDWSVVDNLSNGRVGLGFASGWHDRDFVFAPQNYANRRDVMVESMETVRRLWRGETVTLPGGSGKDAEVAILPRPIQPELPVWVTAAGTPQTYETAGRIGANILTHLLGQTPDTLREKIAIYRSARKHAGHAGPGHVSLMLHTYVHEDMDEVKRAVWHPFREYLRTSVDLIKGLAEGRGQDMRSTEFTKEDMDALLDHAFHRYFDTSALMGTPESCFNMVEQLKGMDIDEIACLIDFGVPEADVMKSLELLGELRRRSDESSASASADFDIPAQLERWQVTHFQCTPSMASMLMQSPEARPTLAGLGCLMIGGEAFPPALAAELRSLVRGRVVNMYGPTETTIWSTTQQVAEEPGSIPLGTPIANTRCYVLDRHQELVPIGVPGELLIGGHGVVRGYHARPELTAERFLVDRFRGQGRMYRTGDLVRWRTDGRLEFLGRIDHQVKVRGHRIELGEIESVLEARADVREAVVVVREFGPGDSRLVGYVVPAVGVTVDPAALRKAVGERLPEYMVPAHIVTLERLPRTPNLKIDRKALPAPSEGQAVTTTPFVKPASELESQIAAIWRDVLRVEQVGVNENFFDIGGHSLLTVKVHVRLRASIDRPVSITDLFRFPTIRTLAEHLGGAAPAAPTGERVQARADARREALQNRRGRRGPT